LTQRTQAIHRPRDPPNHHVPTRSRAVSGLTSIGASAPSPEGVSAPVLSTRRKDRVPRCTAVPNVRPNGLAALAPMRRSRRF
jgi:hypothetical protein